MQRLGDDNVRRPMPSMPVSIAISISMSYSKVSIHLNTDLPPCSHFSHFSPLCYLIIISYHSISRHLRPQNIPLTQNRQHSNVLYSH